MNLKRFQEVPRLIIIVGLILVSLEMVATPVPAVLADFPVGVGFDGSAWLDSENPPYFTNTSATFLNPYAVKGTASYTWPGGATTAWPDFAWWYGFTTNAQTYTTYEFSLVGAHPGPNWCAVGYPQLRLVARGYPGYLPVDSPDGHYLATFPWPVELYAIKVYGRGCNIPGYHEDWNFVLNLLSVDGNPVPTPTCYSLHTSLNLPQFGTVIASPATNCFGKYQAGTVVALSTVTSSAISPDYAFAGWTGDVNSPVYPLTVKMDSDKRITANFGKAMNVYIVMYTTQGVPFPYGVSNPFMTTDDLSRKLLRDLTAGTAYHAYSDPSQAPYLAWQALPVPGAPGEIVHSIPGMVPTNCGLDKQGRPIYGPCRPKPEGVADYARILNDIRTHFGDDICSLVRSGEVQEVWVWHDGASIGHMAERVARGPRYTAAGNKYRVPNCGAQYAVMGLNFNREEAAAMESYAHRVEDAFHQLFPCEFDEPVRADNGVDDYWLIHTFMDPVSHQGKTLDTRILNLTSRCSSSRGYITRARTKTEVAQCGWAHFSPNVTWDAEQSEGITDIGKSKLERRGYQRDDLQFTTGCQDWNPNPAIPQTITPLSDCRDVSLWQCAQLGMSDDEAKMNFHIWWMQNIPGEGNTIKRCDGTSLGNWWDYLRGDLPKKGKVNCNPNSPTSVSLSGSAYLGPLAGAAITLYTLEPGGALLPVTFTEQISTTAEGTYLTPALSPELNGKTLVVKAEGGNFMDEATGQVISFEDSALYSVVPLVDLDRPLGGVVTPLTDLAFRLTQHALIANPSLAPDAEAEYYNAWAALIFGLGESEGVPTDITLVQPANLYDGQPHNLESPTTVYALTLAGLSQQAANAGLSPIEWLAQFDADASDGILDGAVGESIQSLSSAIEAFLVGPHNPFLMPTSTPTDMDTPTPTAPSATPRASDIPTATQTGTPTPTPTNTATLTPVLTATDTSTATPMSTSTVLPTLSPAPSTTLRASATPMLSSTPYPFNGFLPPVNNQPTLNVLKAGSAIPVKFSLGVIRAWI